MAHTQAHEEGEGEMMEIHPIAQKFKRLDEFSYAALRKHIIAHGLKRPIALFDGMIWDGRERFDICEELQIAPKFKILRTSQTAIEYLLLRHKRYGKPQSKTRTSALEILFEIESDPYIKQQKTRRSDWIKYARKEFKTFHLDLAPKHPCAVCGDHVKFVHAHHLLPLSIQFELGIEKENVNHSFEWLCPVHHKYVHMLISVYITQTRSGDFLDFLPDHVIDEWNNVETIFKQGRELYEFYGGSNMWDAPYDVREVVTCQKR